MNFFRAAFFSLFALFASASVSLAQYGSQSPYGGDHYPSSQMDPDLVALERRVAVLERLYQEAHGTQATLPPPGVATGGNGGPRQSLYHTIQRGETLHGIAQIYGVGVQDLANANGISRYSPIYAGGRLIIPERHSAPNPTLPVSGTWNGTYVVRGGDTLHSIARMHGTTAEKLAQQNRLHDPNRIRVGQTLVVPGGGTGGQPSHPQREETYHYYDVVSGDTVPSIASMFYTTPQEVLRLNGLSSSVTLRPGQQLIVPTSRYFDELRRQGIVTD